MRLLAPPPMCLLTSGSASSNTFQVAKALLPFYIDNGGQFLCRLFLVALCGFFGGGEQSDTKKVKLLNVFFLFCSSHVFSLQ